MTGALQIRKTATQDAGMVSRNSDHEDSKVGYMHVRPHDAPAPAAPQE